MSKHSHLLLLPMLAGALHAQTFNEAPPSTVDPSVLLELPPAVVIDEDGKTDPVLVTPKVKIPAEKTVSEGGTTTAKSTDGGIEIQIEKTNAKAGAQQGGGNVKVYSPYPAKPISNPPLGWKYAPAPKGTAPFRTQVVLASGHSVDLAITPYVLIPQADGRNIIKISEPGYDAAKSYNQQDTVGAMLENSTAEIENHEKQAAAAISRLQQLLSSLPRSQK
ncbi:hypothetical protein JIN77_06480 [Verrucomicrobiaceae bacterium R5-34]|nr:hypothetical protein [Verrucomicrobiaceae bacterium R5-34]